MYEKKSLDVYKKSFFCHLALSKIYKKVHFPLIKHSGTRVIYGKGIAVLKLSNLCLS